MCRHRPEEYYDREEIFGRDVTSVFPKQVCFLRHACKHMAAKPETPCTRPRPRRRRLAPPPKRACWKLSAPNDSSGAVLTRSPLAQTFPRRCSPSPNAPSESELETIKATRGSTADDGTVTVLKPLVEVMILAEGMLSIIIRFPLLPLHRCFERRRSVRRLSFRANGR